MTESAHSTVSRYWTVQQVDEQPFDPDAGFERIVAAGRPLLLRGLVKDWPAVERWSSLDYIEQRVGRRSIPISFFPNRGFNDAERVRTELPFAAIRERVFDAADEPAKVNLQMREEERPGLGSLLDDISIPKGLPEATRPRLFSGKDYVTQIHYHFNNEAILCNAVGTKRMFLFKPADFKRLYPYRWNRDRFAQTRLIFDFDSTDFDVSKYPEAGGLEVIEAVVRPGDGLFVPVYWPHLTFSYGASFAVTLFWDAALPQLLSSTLLFRRNHLRRKDPP